MLKMTFQSNCVFLGKKRKAGDVIDTELAEALAAGRTTMTAVTAMKNQQLAILQDTEEQKSIDRLNRLETIVERIAEKMGINVSDLALIGSEETKKKRATK